MPKLNPNILTDPLGGISTQFGVPSCILSLAKDVLGLLPGDVLGGLYDGVSQGQLAARGCLANINRSIFRDLGIIEYDTTTGKLVFLSDTSQWGVDGQGSNVFTKLGSFLGQVAGFGAELWRNYQVATEYVQQIEDCLDEFERWLGGVENKSNIKSESELAATPGKVAIYKQQLSVVKNFLQEAGEFQTTIEEIFEERERDPSLIPVFVDEEEEVVEDPIFRLTFGPPQAKQGQFLLSVDGLYYNSQTRAYGTSGDPTDVPTIGDLSALQFIPDDTRWLLDHSPNLGGRGSSYSLDDLDRYVNTIFDINTIDESKDLIYYYDADHTVQFMISQKNKRIDDIYGNLTDLLVSGYSKSSAIYLNFEQQIITESASFNNKINKRKKQIEVAVKTPDLFGVSSIFPIGEIPINDFSYLSSINLDIEISKQKNLSFDHGEVSGLILPVVPKYVHAPESKQKVVITPLQVTPPGAGSVIDGEDLEGQAPVLSLVTGITVDNLIAVYNFTDVNFQTPGSTVFNTLNCNALGVENRAQTVTVHPKLLFQKGLSIPYLTGIPVVGKLSTFNQYTGGVWDTEPFEIVDAGNYVRLPDVPDYQNLMYNTEGATIDFWTYIPGLYQQEDGWWQHPFTTSSFDFSLSSSTSKWCDSHYYRILLGCENTGGENTGLSQSGVTIDDSSDSVKGMLMGFSRDPRMYFEASTVNPGNMDFNPRQNFGGIVDSVTAYPNNTNPDGHNYANNTSGTWIVSSCSEAEVCMLNKPQAFQQPSGTFIVSGDSRISYYLTSGSDGDGLIASSNNTQYLLHTSAYDGANANALSATFGLSYFNTGSDRTLNIGTPSTVFFIAPTRSYNTSAVGFTKSLECAQKVGEILRFTVPDRLTVNGVNLMDCVDRFIHISISFDVDNNKINFYINGNLIKSGSLSQTFGRSEGTPPSVPSFVVPKSLHTSSFEYTSGTVNQAENVDIFNNGPKNNTFFTPWIMGGGWTDGRKVDLSTSSGGFLDTGAGIISSYNGYVGSMKIYKKALNKKEVIQNYNHQKTFFENMDL